MPETTAAALLGELDHYTLIVPDLEDALRMHDLGLNVVVGDLDDPEVWKRVRVDKAALVATTSSDARNTSVASTVRGIEENVRIVGTAGRVADVHHLLPKSGLKIIGEVFKPIRFQLMANPGTKLEDVKTVALPILRHRIIPNFAARSEGMTPDRLVEKLLKEIPATGK